MNLRFLILISEDPFQDRAHTHFVRGASYVFGFRALPGCRVVSGLVYIMGVMGW